jgi:flagellar biogenesis protein FliO
MWQIDHETFQTLWPSLLIILAMVGAMGWGIWKMVHLAQSDRPAKSP